MEHGEGGRQIAVRKAHPQMGGREGGGEFSGLPRHTDRQRSQQPSAELCHRPRLAPARHGAHLNKHSLARHGTLHSAEVGGGRGNSNQPLSSIHETGASACKTENELTQMRVSLFIQNLQGRKMKARLTGFTGNKTAVFTAAGEN